MVNVVHIIDYIEAPGGEIELESMLSAFSCSFADGKTNEEVETFFRTKAVDFAKRRISITYLLIDENGECVGAYTLAHKPLTFKVDPENMSKSGKRRLERYARYDETLHAYVTSAFLIAQFSKNYAITTTSISGNDIMKFTIDEIESIQRRIGGGIVLVECLPNEKLISFYGNKQNNFIVAGERIDITQSDNIKYIQMIRVV